MTILKLLVSAHVNRRNHMSLKTTHWSNVNDNGET